MEDSDIPGNGIKSFEKVKSWGECSNLCRETSGCESFVWVSVEFTLDPSIHLNCYLKSAMAEGVSVSGLIAGASDCYFRIGSFGFLLLLISQLSQGLL